MLSLRLLYHENNTRTPLGLVVFIHEYKSLFLRDHSHYKIVLCEYTPTHSNHESNIQLNNDTSYERKNFVDHLDVSFGLRFQS